MLTVAVVTYNSESFVEDCLRSLLEDSFVPYEILVIDNSSEDRTPAIVKERFPQVKLIINPRNMGYAKAANIALLNSSSAYLLLLNPDIIATRGAIDSLYKFAQSIKDAVVIGPKLLYPDGNPQFSARRFYTIPAIISRRTSLGKFLKESEDSHLMRDEDLSKPQEVDWVTGGCMLINVPVIKEIGGFDERFFLYFEDVDLCLRVWRSGYRVLYFPDAKFLHHYKRESKSGMFNKAKYHHIMSALKFYRKYGIMSLLRRFR